MMAEEQSLKILVDNVNLIQGLSEQEDISISPSPINIDAAKAKTIQLPTLNWINFDKIPTEIKLINTGKTMILSAKWETGSHPYLTGGPLTEKYIFSQIHFHWKYNCFMGSEHTIDGRPLPLELHMMHFKSNYETHNEALKHNDGVVALVFMFTIKDKTNLRVHPIMTACQEIVLMNSTVSIEPFPLTNIIFPFSADYYLYWGSVVSNTRDYVVLWMITREVDFLSVEQMEQIFKLMDKYMRPIVRNSRRCNETFQGQLFHANPASLYTNSTLSPFPLRHEIEVVEFSLARELQKAILEFKEKYEIA